MRAPRRLTKAGEKAISGGSSWGLARDIGDAERWTGYVTPVQNAHVDLERGERAVRRRRLRRRAAGGGRAARELLGREPDVAEEFDVLEL